MFSALLNFIVILNNTFKKICPGKQKPCPIEEGKFGCCKFEEGFCCPDMKTCCPNETQPKSKMCNCKSNSSILTLTKMNAEDKIKTVCPDNSTECAVFETCCSVGYGTFGCCPFKNATCCADNHSCCPNNKQCDLKKKICVPKSPVNSKSEA